MPHKTSGPILIVDDDSSARYGVRRALEADGYETLEVESGEACLALLTKKRVAAVLLDVSMPGMGGQRCLTELVAAEQPPPVIMVTAYGSERLAVECLKQGAYDYLPKPYEIDELRAVVGRATEKRSLEEENQRLKEALAVREGDGSLGVSSSMTDVARLVGRIAPSDVTVLVVGESGTGKELIAHEVHRRSNRAERPFVAVNCAALPDELVESELFGHERGAFTGAVETRKGKFELADRGTLFLDEVAEMTTRTQSKLLRVLQERSFERVGGTRTVSVDVRVVAATNRDLRAEVANGSFREDLYYRLKVAEISLPPLRDRPEDIPALAVQFLQTASARLGREISGFSDDAMRILCSSAWPGNVRELKNAVEYATVMADDRLIESATLPADLLSGTRATNSGVAAEGGLSDLVEITYADARRMAIERFERFYIERRLEQAGGNVSEAARGMGIARQSLQAKLKELDIDPAPFRLRRPR